MTSLKKLAMLAMATVAIQAPLQAAENDFFKGKNIGYIVATNAGGGYDAYGRLVGKYLEKHLEAENVLVKNIPGAGHIIGTNTLAKAKPDGLTIGTFDVSLIYSQILGRDSIRFDLKEFEYIGKAAGEPRTVIVSTLCDIKTVDDLLSAEKPVKFAASGVGSSNYNDIQLLKEALDLNIETIAGYDGTEGEMAMMRGEVCAQVGSASSYQEFVNSGHATYLLAVGGDVSGATRVKDIAKTEKARKIVSLIDAMSQVGRLTAAPPGTPKDRVEALRAAYKASLQDPDLKAEAERMKRPLDPAFGEDVHKLIVNALDQSPETVEIIVKAIGGTSS